MHGGERASWHSTDPQVLGMPCSALPGATNWSHSCRYRQFSFCLFFFKCQLVCRPTMCHHMCACVRVCVCMYAGNCVVISPSEHCTHTAELLHRLLPSYLDNVSANFFKRSCPNLWLMYTAQQYSVSLLLIRSSILSLLP